MRLCWGILLRTLSTWSSTSLTFILEVVGDIVYEWGMFRAAIAYLVAIAYTVYSGNVEL